MRFNLKFVLAVSALSLLSSCGTDLQFDTGNDNIIGEKVQSVSSLSDSSGQSDRTQIAIFDKTVRKIHQFDLNRMSVMRTLSVLNEGEQHSVMFDQASGLVIDFSNGHLTLFDRDGNETRDPLEFTGKPISIAYRPANGTLIVYDDMSSVGILKLGPTGQVIKRWLGGPLLGGSTGATVTAGDLNDQDQLILALSDGSIATVDIAQTLANSAWSFTKAATTLGRIRWVAPVRGTTDKAMVVSGEKVYLVSTTDGSVLAEKWATKTSLLSKSKDPHVVTVGYKEVQLIYATATTLETRSLTVDVDYVAESRLSLAEDAWSFIDSKKAYSMKYGQSGENELAGRNLRKYRLTDMAALKKMDLPDQASIQTSANYIFALFPSELGKADRIAISDGAKAEIKLFNLGHIKRR
ncbi:MAG: hypothetical protein EOP05_09190 [Proteobacteria bacterium]|nr:MAG: hypothetical protein EOP05_09190 [Pseudomonadota bacterium]